MIRPKILSDEKIQKVIGRYETNPMYAHDRRIAQAQNDYDWQEMLGQFRQLPIGEFRIVNKEFVDGEPNCVIILMVDWRALQLEER